MTVSRVLRGSPRVAPGTRARVLEAVSATGYRPDPQVSRLMELVRVRKKRGARAKIALIRDDLADDVLHGASYHYVATEDVRTRAERHGYDVEEFVLGGGGMQPGRLAKILRTRAIDGLLVSAQSSRLLSARLDYGNFAAATFGFGLASPSLHRASTNMMQGLLEVASRLEARGYKRIGLAVSPWVDVRADKTYTGALLVYQQGLPPSRRVPIFLFQDNDPHAGRDRFLSWIKRWRPDVIISFHDPIPDWLRRNAGLRIPEDIGLVIHDWLPEMTGFAGIDHRRGHVAAAAVDLVAGQLHHNEKGVPEVPRQILIPPRFVDGPSLRAAPIADGR